MYHIKTMAMFIVYPSTRISCKSSCLFYFFFVPSRPGSTLSVELFPFGRLAISEMPFTIKLMTWNLTSNAQRSIKIVWPPTGDTSADVRLNEEKKLSKNCKYPTELNGLNFFYVYPIHPFPVHIHIPTMAGDHASANCTGRSYIYN